MQFFRSEERARRHCRAHQQRFGQCISIEQGFELGQCWYRGRLYSDWRPLTDVQRQSIFDKSVSVESLRALR
ncbi:MAG: hypothetical protein KDK91_17550 [Gammaproteobacteria bacterium]|nr:hypothetical protein [Gammaproteobacteria bacterium]